MFAFRIEVDIAQQFRICSDDEQCDQARLAPESLNCGPAYSSTVA
jgi:hypothetical protein